MITLRDLCGRFENTIIIIRCIIALKPKIFNQDVITKSLTSERNIAGSLINRYYDIFSLEIFKVVI